MRRFPRDATTLFFDPRAEPLAEVADGERLVVETADSLCGLAKARLAGRPAAAGMHIDEVLERLGGACPVTGPLHLAGSRTATGWPPCRSPAGRWPCRWRRSWARSGSRPAGSGACRSPSRRNTWATSTSRR